MKRGTYSEFLKSGVDIFSLFEKDEIVKVKSLHFCSQGQGSLVGCGLWGRTESDTIEAT